MFELKVSALPILLGHCSNTDEDVLIAICRMCVSIIDIDSCEFSIIFYKKWEDNLNSM